MHETHGGPNSEQPEEGYDAYLEDRSEDGSCGRVSPEPCADEADETDPDRDEDGQEQQVHRAERVHGERTLPEELSEARRLADGPDIADRADATLPGVAAVAALLHRLSCAYELIAHPP